MGRHSQSSSLTTTLVELGGLAQRSLTAGGSHGRRRAEGAARTSLGPVAVRAGGAAAALALLVSGGAYAAASKGSPDIKPLSHTRTEMMAIGASGSDASASADAGTQTAVTVPGQRTEVTTLTQDTTDPAQTIEEETAALPAGQTKVKTEGVDGLTRTTYQVTTTDGVETDRQEVSSVVVTQRVDKVVLIGTGTGTTPESAKAIAKAMLAERGWGEDQFQCLDRLWTRESHWNYQARNSSSGAYGIPQALPGSKMGSVAADWQTNPATQITWGLGYIAGRYGNPCGAWAHSQSTGWY